MNCDEYIQSFTSSVLADAETYQTPEKEQFLVSVGENLVESEVITSFETGYFYKKVGTSFAEINGFSYEGADGSFNLFFVDDLNSIEETFTNTLLNKALKRAETFVKAALEMRFIDWEESSFGYEAASQLYRLYQNRDHLDFDVDLKKIHIYILTNKVLSQRFSNQQRSSLYDIPVGFSVYDANRLYDMAKSGFEKEPVNVSFLDFGVQGIYALKSASLDAEFDSYLATVPGQVLADMYLKYGTQILEGNVRAFLSVRGKVNKGIRRTILEEPEKFFILNNGITVTSDGIRFVNDESGLMVTEIDDLQIVNGGQTTASLANALVKDKADLSQVQVMMKLSVLKDHSVATRLVPEISRASNSQNKVDEADFFSNHPYHVKLEELSKKTLAPAVDGNQFETVWFYERARGQYTVDQLKLTPTQSKAWQAKHPKKQVLRKTDIAKYVLSFEGYPQSVSKGAQRSMKEFSLIIQGPNGDDGVWAKKSSEINGKYFKELVAKAILFKETEKLVSSYDWYKVVKAYRANIVTYTIALMENTARKMKKTIDLNRIWLNQALYPSLIEQIGVTSKQVYDFLIRDDRETQNVTEWAKKDACWKRAKDEKYLSLVVMEDFKDDLVDKEQTKKKEVNEAVVDSMTFVFEKPVEVWKNLKIWGEKYLYLSPRDKSFLELAEKLHTQGKIPTDRQFNEIVNVYNMLVSKGYVDSTIT